MKKLMIVLCLLFCGVCFAQGPFTPQYVSYTTSTLVPTIGPSGACNTTSCWISIPSVPNKTVIALSAASDHSLWAVTSDHRAFMHTPGTNNWVDKSANKAGYVAEIAVANATTVYARTTSQHNFQYNFSTNQWGELINDNYPPASGTALLTNDMAVGSDGDLWVVGSDTLGCGKRLYHRDLVNNKWLSTPFSGSQVAVADQYAIWSRCSDGSINYLDFDSNTNQPVLDAGAGTARSMAVDAENSVWLVTNTVFSTGNYYPSVLYSDNTLSSDGANLPLCCSRIAGGISQMANGVGAPNSVFALTASGAIVALSKYTRYVSQLIQGTTTCSFGCNMTTNTQHTGNVSARAAGNSSGTSNSQSVNWSNYISVTAWDNTVNSYEVVCGDSFTSPVSCSDYFETLSNVICPARGIVSSGGGSMVSKYIEEAHVWAKYTNTQSSCWYTEGHLRCKYSADNWCTPETSPPDYPIRWVLDNPPVYNNVTYWLTHKTCWRFEAGEPWNCSPLNINNAEKVFNSNMPLQECTHNP